MAETLGSLIDKLSIKSIREFYLQKMKASRKAKFSKQSLVEKLSLVKKQKQLLLEEVECFISQAVQGQIPLRDDKVKLYNKPGQMGKIGRIEKLAYAFEALSKKNMELWQLEDEARRDDKGLEYIGKTKKKIDFVNQQRNDLIDRIDKLFDERVKKYSRAKRRAK